jgi:hypothetical protein
MVAKVLDHGAEEQMWLGLVILLFGFLAVVARDCIHRPKECCFAFKAAFAVVATVGFLFKFVGLHFVKPNATSRAEGACPLLAMVGK